MNEANLNKLSPELLKSVFHEMIFVEGGIFTMGSDKPEDSWDWAKASPAYEVQLSGYQLGKYPVTQSLWALVMGENPSHFRGKRRPVERVSWEDITEKFLPRLNELTGRLYRLPTEAEWEYAAKGGKYKSTYVYSGSDELATVGWHWNDGNNYNETMPVGLKSPNALGIYDMSGNVWEWCQDKYAEAYYQLCADEGLVTDPQGAESGHTRVIRGGSWSNSAQYCRVANRDHYHPGNRINSLGFRLAL